MTLLHALAQGEEVVVELEQFSGQRLELAGNEVFSELVYGGATVGSRVLFLRARGLRA